MKHVLLAASVVLVACRLGLAGDVDRHVRWRASEAAGAKQPVGWLVREAVVMVSTPPERLATDSPQDKAAEVFESLYGADVARVTKTRDKTDDVDFAKRLLATARQEAAGKPALVTVLCEKAADLAGPREGVGVRRAHRRGLRGTVRPRARHREGGSRRVPDRVPVGPGRGRTGGR